MSLLWGGPRWCVVAKGFRCADAVAGGCSSFWPVFYLAFVAFGRFLLVLRLACLRSMKGGLNEAAEVGEVGVALGVFFACGMVAEEEGDSVRTKRKERRPFWLGK